MKKTALITGITGQDGAYLAELLLKNNYQVIGITRAENLNSITNLLQLGINQKVHVVRCDLFDINEILKILDKYSPHEIYHLSGQSSVSLSFELPFDTVASHVSSTLNLLNALLILKNKIKFYYAGSSECFGDCNGIPSNELTSFKPKSPYGIAKSCSYWLVKNYRETYNMYLCTGILFNHESPLRPASFVTKKIIKTACRISNGSNEKLKLGNLFIYRDWGWAPEYVEAMFMMLQKEEPTDYVIATGETNSLKDFLVNVFESLDLDWNDHVVIDQGLQRPNDLIHSSADPKFANESLNWSARTKMKSVTKYLINAEKSIYYNDT